jgi:hypothetical protein
MDFVMLIRFAFPQDASQIVKVLIHSITYGCILDHHNKKNLLDNWLENKTKENVLKWITDLNNISVVSVDEFFPEINGVGLISKSGVLKLLYVMPESEKRGIGASIFEKLQIEVKNLGVEEITLNSTLTAKIFYEKQGCIVSGTPAHSVISALACPMSKKLT